MLLLLAVSISILSIPPLLIERRWRTRALQLLPISLAIAFVKVSLITLTPQWADVSPDTLTYEKQATAIAMHFDGQSVNAVAYGLFGVAHKASVWAPDDDYSLSTVLGTMHWLYPAFLSLWSESGLDWATAALASNMLLLTGLPFVAFGVARCLGASIPIAFGAAVLTALDISLAVNASWAFKDTLVAWLAGISTWLICLSFTRLDLMRSVLLSCALAFLFPVRYVVFSILVLSSVFLAAARTLQERRLAFGAYLVPVLLSLPLAVAISSFPLLPNPLTAVSQLLGPAQWATGLVVTEIDMDRTVPAAQITGDQITGDQITGDQITGDQITDETVSGWYERLYTDPIRAIAQSIARTLMAPYPWSVLMTGISGDNAMELYALGSAQFIPFLPFLFLGVLAGAKMAARSNTNFFVLFLLLGTLGAYVVFFGEWSTRQRTFLMPILYIYVCIGFNSLVRHFPSLLWFFFELKKLIVGRKFNQS